jgi:hypothetical protein
LIFGGAQTFCVYNLHVPDRLIVKTTAFFKSMYKPQKKPVWSAPNRLFLKQKVRKIFSGFAAEFLQLLHYQLPTEKAGQGWHEILIGGALSCVRFPHC